jgi:hypothetical protein
MIHAGSIVSLRTATGEYIRTLSKHSDAWLCHSSNQLVQALISIENPVLTTIALRLNCS